MFVYFFLLLFLEIKTLISNMKVYLVTFGSSLCSQFDIFEE